LSVKSSRTPAGSLGKQGFGKNGSPFRQTLFPDIHKA
jgi:hypothetical protein